MRRLDVRPDGRFALGSTGRKSCPAVIELDDGDFLIIGKDVTNTLGHQIPESVGVVADDEQVVLIPRVVLTVAKPNIPNE